MEKSKSASSEGSSNLSPKFKNHESTLDTSNSSREGKKRKSSRQLKECKKFSPDISECESASLAERAARYEEVYRECWNVPATPTKKKIGFIGLGNIGLRAVRNLRYAGHTVIIWNRTTEKCIPFKELLNIQVAATPADVVVAADITFCCVSDAGASETIVFGKRGILEGLRSCPGSNKGYIELTKMDSDSHKAASHRIKLNGGRYLDAPITGSRVDAKKGTLYIQASGDKSLYDESKTCFDAIAIQHKYLGTDVGHASDIRILFGTFEGTVYCALAEAIELSQRSNVDVADVLDLMEDDLLGKSLVQKGQAMIDNNYTPQIPLKHLLKDFSIGLQMADAIRLATPVAKQADLVLTRCMSKGHGEKDVTVVFENTKPW